MTCLRLGANECDDGIDNDSDGLIDLADAQCVEVAGASETTNVCVPTDPDLFAYWKFDETTAGTDAADATGNGNVGSVSGPGPPNNLPRPHENLPPAISYENVRSLDFDRNDDFVKTSVGVGGDYTIAFWLHPNSSDTWGTLFSNPNSTVGAVVLQGG